MKHFTFYGGIGCGVIEVESTGKAEDKNDLISEEKKQKLSAFPLSSLQKKKLHLSEADVLS